MSSLDDKDRDNLAAFLDGELDDAATQELEAKLARDPDARKEVDSLRQAWNMLDYLPKAEASANFTNRTLEKLALVNSADRTVAAKPAQRSSWMPLVGWTLALLLAIGTGLGLGTLAWPSRVEVEEPQLQVLRALGHADDPILIKALDRPDLFGDEGEKPATPDREVVIKNRYLEWLVRLDDAERRTDKVEDVGLRQIKEAADTPARLLAIERIKERKWINSQPKDTRDKLASLKDPERAELIAQLRKEDRLRRQAWAQAAPFVRELDKNPMPTRVGEFPREIQEYYFEYLKPRLPKEEVEKLNKVEGQWPKYLQTLIEVAQAYPCALKGVDGPRGLKELPREVEKRLRNNKKLAPKIAKVSEGKWPEFASQIANYAYRSGVDFPYEYLATHVKSLSPPMQIFIQDKLEKQLSTNELERLRQAEGRWPEYPETIQALAAAHQLSPPWMTLPGPLGRLSAWGN